MALRAVGRKAPSSKFSSTVSLGKRRRPSGTSVMPRSTISSVLQPTRSCRSPSISATMPPELGRTMPMMHFLKVLLPLPLVPSSTTVSACDTESEMSSSTRTAPYPAFNPVTERLFAKIGPFDLRVAHDVLRQAVGDLLAGDEHDEPGREAHYRAHDVFDQDDRDALLVEAHEDGDDLLDLGRRQP